jgi:hypothetical protein
MKKFTKTMMAAALLAGAGAANATIVANTISDGIDNGLNEAFLVVYDPGFVGPAGLGRTYNLDLNVTFTDILANPVTALQGITLDANWNTFLSTSTGLTNLKYFVGVGAEDQATSFLTFSEAPQANVDPTVLVGANHAVNTVIHAREINVGTAGADSSIILQVPDNFSGQATHDGGAFETLWAGTIYNVTGTGGQPLNLWKETYTFDALGNAITTQDQITNVGYFTLSADSLSFAPPAAIPLPAAVWMFGAGLMGLLRANRRKLAAA